MNIASKTIWNVQIFGPFVLFTPKSLSYFLFDSRRSLHWTVFIILSLNKQLFVPLLWLEIARKQTKRYSKPAFVTWIMHIVNENQKWIDLCPRVHDMASAHRKWFHALIMSSNGHLYSSAERQSALGSVVIRFMKSNYSSSHTNFIYTLTSAQWNIQIIRVTRAQIIVKKIYEQKSVCANSCAKKKGKLNVVHERNEKWSNFPNDSSWRFRFDGKKIIEKIYKNYSSSAYQRAEFTTYAIRKKPRNFFSDFRWKIERDGVFGS